jgi:ornithine cyclodeaminase/alanine dehydrogenase-like protein (mu-crystallin family)
MLLIDNEIVAKVVSPGDCIDIQEQAFGDLQTGRAIHRPRIDMYAPCSREDGYYRWSSMEGVTVRPGPYLAMRVKSDIAYWPRTADGQWTEKKFCVEPGLYCGLILIFSTETGGPLAMINDGMLQHFRVGGGAGLGAKYLSRPESRTVGLLGSGGMAKAYLQAFMKVRPIDEARVYSPTAANREAFAEAMGHELGIRVQPVASAEEAVRGADIVASCTDSMAPTIRPEWLSPGMHVTNVGPYEIDQECLARFDVKIRQGEAGSGSEALRESDRLRREVGQSPLAYVAGTEAEMQRLPPRPPGRIGFGGNFPHIAELINGVRHGRTSPDQITFYHNFGNQGLQFACVGGMVFERAKEQGLGRRLPDEWFLQTIRN